MPEITRCREKNPLRQRPGLETNHRFPPFAPMRPLFGPNLSAFRVWPTLGDLSSSADGFDNLHSPEKRFSETSSELSNTRITRSGPDSPLLSIRDTFDIFRQQSEGILPMEAKQIAKTT